MSRRRRGRRRCAATRDAGELERFVAMDEHAVEKIVRFARTKRNPAPRNRTSAWAAVAPSRIWATERAWSRGYGARQKDAVTIVNTAVCCRAGLPTASASTATIVKAGLGGRPRQRLGDVGARSSRQDRMLARRVGEQAVQRVPPERASRRREPPAREDVAPLNPRKGPSSRRRIVRAESQAGNRRGDGGICARRVRDVAISSCDAFRCAAALTRGGGRALAPRHRERLAPARRLGACDVAAAPNESGRYDRRQLVVRCAADAASRMQPVVPQTLMIAV